jgi:hypothetical protein
MPDAAVYRAKAEEMRKRGNSAHDPVAHQELLSLAVKYETLGLPINVGRAPPLATSSRAAQCAQSYPDACRLAVLYSADGSRVQHR